MQRFESKIDSKSGDYKEQFEHNCKLMETLAERQKAVREASAKNDQRLIAQGKLPARQRVELLLDLDSDFLGLSTLAAHGLYDNESPGAGLIAGIGIVNGVECLISANNPSIKGGTSYPISVDKSLRAQEI